jgi:ABC-type uncharacterized transport system substrate-binding protein
VSQPVWAHPHVSIDGRQDIVFNAKQQIVAVRAHWVFDKAFSSFASVGLDKNGDGKFSREELAPLAKINAESLKEYNYFTHLSIGKKEFSFKPPVNYYLTESKGRLTLHFTLPLAEPVKVTGKTVLQVFDPEYFIAFKFNARSASLIKASSACSVVFQPPRELDAETMAKIAAVPKEQHNLPPALRDAAAGLANLFIIRCLK